MRRLPVLLALPAALAAQGVTVRTDAPFAVPVRTLVIEHADSAEYLRVEPGGAGTVVLNGRIVVRSGDLRLRADRIVVDLGRRTAFGTGAVLLEDAHRRLSGSAFFYDIRQGRGIVYDAATVEDGILFRGARIKTLGTNALAVRSGEFSTCAYRMPHFFLETRRMWIRPDRSFFMLHVFYRTGGLRLFYLPFAFQLSRGTGIHSYAGYDSFRGYFVQNTWEGLMLPSLRTELRADLYQFGGGYAAAILSHTYGPSSTELQLHGSRDRVRLPDGRPAVRWSDYVWRGFAGAKERLDLRSGLGRTVVDAYWFAASDHLFNHDYISHRNRRSGIGLPGSVLPRAVSPPLEQDAWYVDLVHTAGPFAVSLRQRWNLYWNRAKEDFALGTVHLPHLTASWNGRLRPLPETASPVPKLLLNGYDLRLALALRRTLFYDYGTAAYLKTETETEGQAALGRRLRLPLGLSYAAEAGLGVVERSGRDLTPEERANLRRLSFAWWSWSDRLGFDLAEVLPKPVLRPSLGLGRRWRYRFDPSADSDAASYGGVVDHAAELTAGLAADPWFSWSGRMPVDLRVLTNDRLDLSDRRRYNILLQTASLRLGRAFRLEDTLLYSVREDRWVENRLTFGLSPWPVLEADLSWLHSWASPASSRLSAGYTLRLSPDRHTRIVLSVRSANDRLYLYDAAALRAMGLPGSLRRDVWRDLADAFSVLNPRKRSWDDAEPLFSTERLERTAFKLRSVSVTYERDLHCWFMDASYGLRQARTYIPGYGEKSYWEHTVQVRIAMKRFDSLRHLREFRTEPPRSADD